MKNFFIFLFVLAWGASHAQQNLVPNPSFEEYTNCPTNGGQLEYALYWTNPLIGSSPDYLNACGIPTWSVPKNGYGYEPARSGVAYAAIVLAEFNPFSPAANNFREYVEVELLDSLKGGLNYCFRFYVSTCDSTHWVTSNIGIYFSKTEVRDTCYPCGLNYTPQFENSESNDITNKIGWSLVSGIYKASGGEKYITIGNFRDASHTQADSVGGGATTNLYKQYAAVYLDDVLLYCCDSTSGFSETLKSQIRIFPNPFANVIHAESETTELNQIDIFNIIGNSVLHKTERPNQKKITVVVDELPKGTYILSLSNQESKVNYKIIKN